MHVKFNSKDKYTVNQGWSTNAMLRDFAVVCTHLQTITLAIAMTTRKAIHMGSYEYGALLGNPSGHWSSTIIY